MSHPLGPISISIFFVIEALLVKPQLYALYAETWHGFFLGFLAFAFGFLFVYSEKSFWNTVQEWKWLYFGVAIVLFGIRFFIYNTEAPSYLASIESNCWIFALFGFGRKHLNHPSKILRYLSTAAYPVYIIHMGVLYLSALLILPLKIPVILKFVAITCFTFLICLLLYEFVIRRIALLRPLFGLKWAKENSNPKVPEKESSQNYGLKTKL